METRELRCADELLEAINLDGGDWPHEDPYAFPWIFRGQGDAKWGLVPRAWREGAAAAPLLQHFLGEAKRCGHVSVGSQHLWAEAQLLREFQRLANEVGLPCPADANRGIPHPPPTVFMTKDGPTPDVTSPLAVLAQHHGLPTRLLDWTRDPRAAAFFAADDATAASAPFAVWALDTRLVEPNRVRLISPPRSENAYLHAQNAVMLAIEHVDLVVRETGRWPTIEWAVPPQALRKYVLPSEARGPLLRLLWKHRVTRAHLMPSYGSVTTSLESRYVVQGAMSASILCGASLTGTLAPG